MEARAQARASHWPAAGATPRPRPQTLSLGPRPARDRIVIYCLPKTAKSTQPLSKESRGGVGHGALATPMAEVATLMAEVTTPGTVLSPGSWSPRVTQAPLHCPPSPIASQTLQTHSSFRTPSASPKPGSLLSVHFYFGNLDSALEFYKPGRNGPSLGTFLCPCLPSHNAPVLCSPGQNAQHPTGSGQTADHRLTRRKLAVFSVSEGPRCRERPNSNTS